MVRKIRVSGISQGYFDQIIKQENGFKFADPVRPDENTLTCVVPILQTQTKDRRYMTFPEVDFIQTHDTGHISQMIAENTGKETVYIRTGTILKGSTQERAIVRSYIVFPGQKVTMEARCVHASKGIREGAKVNYGGIIPLAMEQDLYDDGFKPKDQGSYWNSTSRYSMTVKSMTSQTMAGGTQSRGPLMRPPQPPIIRRSHSPRPPFRTSPPIASARGMSSGINRMVPDQWDDSGIRSFYGNIPNSIHSGTLEINDDLFQTQETFGASDVVMNLLSKLKLVDDQVGLGIIDEKGVQTIELFDVYASWKALHGDAVKRAGSNLVRDDSSDVFKFAPEFANDAICKVLGSKFKENVIYEWRSVDNKPAVTVIGLTGEKHVGELVELDGRVIHMVLNRAA